MQASLFTVLSLSSALAFSFSDLAVLPENSRGAKAFYALWMVMLFAVIPGQ